MIGAILNSGTLGDAGELYFGERGSGFGFPVPANLRDLRRDSDASFF